VSGGVPVPVYGREAVDLINSAHTVQQNCRHHHVLVVTREDGGIYFVDTLMPRIIEVPKEFLGDDRKVEAALAGFVDQAAESVELTKEKYTTVRSDGVFTAGHSPDDLAGEKPIRITSDRIDSSQLMEYNRKLSKLERQKVARQARATSFKAIDSKWKEPLTRICGQLDAFFKDRHFSVDDLADLGRAEEELGRAIELYAVDHPELVDLLHELYDWQAEGRLVGLTCRTFGFSD
jgi:hypothetical protein